MSGQDLSRGLGIKGQASDLEVLAQTLGLGNWKGVGTKHWVQGTAHHREGVGHRNRLSVQQQKVGGKHIC